MKKSTVSISLMLACLLLSMPAQARAEGEKQIAEEAYVYAFPMLMNYGTLFAFNVDAGSKEYKGPFNVLTNEARVFTPADTTVVTPNSDTPYSFVTMDLRAEPFVICVPEIEEDRYYSIQIIDMYTFNFGYVGSRTTGNGAGCFAITGPGWKGETPAGIAQTFPSETEFAIALFRTQLFGSKDIENVREIQADYVAQPLSSFLKQPAPPAAPAIAWPTFEKKRTMEEEPFGYLNFLLQFAPSVAAETALRERFATIGIEPGKSFDVSPNSLWTKAELKLAVVEGFEKIEKAREALGRKVNGWSISDFEGSRAGYAGDWTKRAAIADAGIYANDAVEALYPMLLADSEGQKPDGSKGRYTLTFPADGLPPVDAFWSVTMYDGRTQLLVSNPIDRYLINSPMLPDLAKNPDGSLTIHIQKDSPGADAESNWLPAPDGPIYLVMRLYRPKAEALEGKWSPPPLVRVR
jgi:hypothetical protein